MAMVYHCNVSEMQDLAARTSSVQDILTETKTEAQDLTDTMRKDGKWDGTHKDVLMAWMDLLGLFHAQLEDESIGSRMSKRIDEFAKRIESFEGNSTNLTELWSI